MQAATHTAPPPFPQGDASRVLEALAQQAAQQVPAQSDNNLETELSHIVELGYN